MYGNNKPKIIATAIVKSKVKYKFGQDITKGATAISKVTGLIE